MTDQWGNPDSPPRPPGDQAGTAEFGGRPDAAGTETTFPRGSMQPGVRIAGRYKLLEAVGEGGMGEVWIAEQTEPVRRKVALKLIKPGMDSRQVVARFEAERQALALMDHPNIAKVHDGGLTEQGRPFFVMEYVKGVPITDYCDANRLNVLERLQLFMQVCQAVQHAHQKGIIHRDLKPTNILVSAADGGPAPKVIDFGLAKAMHQSLTERTLHTARETVLGTPLYMSPEQAQTDSIDVDTRSDVYSLGVLLYELLTGTTPVEKRRFKEAAWDEVRRIIREEEPPRPSTRLSSIESLPSLAACRHTAPADLTVQIRGELDWIVMKAIEKDRARRYETANGFAMDVGRYLAGEQVLAVPPSTGYRLKKFVRRNRGPVLAASAVAAALVAGIAVATTQAIRARRAEVLAVAERTRSEESFRQARAAVDQYFTAVSESKLLDVPGLQPLRKDLLDAARNYYRNFLSERGDDPVVKAEAALAMFRVAWVGQALGEVKEALEHYNRAADLYGELVRIEPGNVEHQRLYAICYGAQGMALNDLGQREDAIAAHRKALAIRTKILEADPGDPQSQIDVARTHRNIGGIHRAKSMPREALAEWDAALAIGRPLLNRSFPKLAGRVDLTGRTDLSAIVREDVGSTLLDRSQLLYETGCHTDAAVSWKQAVELFEGLVRERPNDLLLRARLADCHSNGASLHYNLGKYDDALSHSQRSLDIRTAMAAANPSVLFYRRTLTEGVLVHGWLQRQLKRDEEALKAYSRATEMAEKLLTEEPESAYTRNLLAQSLGRRGSLLVHLKKPTEGVPYARRAVEIQEAVHRENADAGFHQSTLGIVLRSLGRCEAAAGNHAAALRAFERSADIDGKLAANFAECSTNLACSYALMIPLVTASRKEETAAKAVKALENAIVKGYSNLRSLKTDEDLDALRGRDDFKRLIADLEKRTDSAAK